jgi:hypothetical protein
MYVATFSQQLVVYGLLSEGLGSPIGNRLQEDIPVQGPGDRTFRVERTASFSCRRFTILGTGSDIWGVEDDFHYVYQTVLSDQIDISARAISVADTDDWAKAGVMIRESLDRNSAHAMVVLTPKVLEVLTVLSGDLRELQCAPLIIAHRICTQRLRVTIGRRQRLPHLAGLPSRPFLDSGNRDTQT